MNLPLGIVKKLTCDTCKDHLSCGPIYLNYKTNKVICGRCNPKFPKKLSTAFIRYKHYETLASVSLFPCKYSKHGCPKKLLFSSENPHKHETSCEYRKRGCPIVCSKAEPHVKCKWFGRLITLLHHCKLAHPNQVLTNPCLFVHVFNEPLHETYLITCFDTLFLLTITISDEIVYICRHIGAKQSTAFYRYVVKITAKDSKFEIVRDGAILPETSHHFPKLIFNGNYLQQTFKTPAAYFNLQIEHLTEKPEVKPSADASIYCRNHRAGCTFYDQPQKTKKHETYFCKYLTECPECDSTSFGRNFAQHLVQRHGAQLSKPGKTWHIKEGYKQYCVLSNDDGDVFYLCKYSLACFRLLVNVFTPYSNEQLQEYNCMIRISDPGISGNCYKHRLACEPNACYDWSININMYNYPMWRHYGLDLCVFVEPKAAL